MQLSSHTRTSFWCPGKAGHGDSLRLSCLTSAAVLSTCSPVFLMSILLSTPCCTLSSTPLHTWLQARQNSCMLVCVAPLLHLWCELVPYQLDLALLLRCSTDEAVSTAVSTVNYTTACALSHPEYPTVHSNLAGGGMVMHLSAYGHATQYWANILWSLVAHPRL